MFEESKFNRLAKLEQHAPAILKEFTELLNARELIHTHNASKFRSLVVEQIDAYTIDATYVNTTVRFQLFLTYQEGRAIGRVICLHKYVLFEKTRFDVLGRFTFDPVGQTNLPPTERGEIRTLAGSSDEIVTAFLDQAAEHGPAEFAAE